MAKRIYTETVKKWAKRVGIAGGTLIGLIFAYLFAIGAISNVSYSGDVVCAGTIEDPCYAYINFTANEDIFIYPIGYDPWGRDTLFSFDPAVKSWKLHRSWGTSWREIKLNETCQQKWCGAPYNNMKDNKYSIAFREGRDYRIRITGYKKNPKDTIKWGAFTGVDEIDPVWYGLNIGYEFLDGGKVVHIWNTQDDYYFNKSSGIQFTNHYQDYWTRNIFCIGYYSGGTWNKIKCADEFTDFNKDIQTDNLTYVNATLWKDISYGNYDMRLGINYYLGLNDENLSITIYGKNIGIDIPFDLGFAWKVIDWDIPSNETDDYLIINNTGYPIKGTYELTFKNMDETFFKGRDTTYAFGGEFLRVDWNENLNYAVKMYGDGNQENFYVALLINAGSFSIGQEKSTTFYWIDAVALGTNAGFVTEAPEDDPGGLTSTADTHANSIKDTSPALAAKITEIGWWCDTATEEANFEVGLYTDEGNDEPEARLYVNNTNAKGTDAGWKNVTVDWEINGSTDYWLAVQLDDTDTKTNADWAGSGGSGTAWRTDTTLPSDWGTSNYKDIDAMYAIYAVVELGPDETPPTYSNAQTNTTINGTTILFSVLYDDDTVLETAGQYIFSTNNTGAWANESAVNFTTTPEWANVTKILNSTEGLLIGYRWYADDNLGNVNNTEIFTLTITAAPEDTCTYSSGNWDVDCDDNCSITSNVNLGGNNLTLSNDNGVFIVQANITNFDKIFKYDACEIRIYSSGGFN